MRKLFTRLCALLMCLSLLPLSVLAVDWEPDWDEEDDVLLDDDELVWSEGDFIIGEEHSEEIAQLDNLETDDTVAPDDLEKNTRLPADVMNILLIGIDSHDKDINYNKTSHLNDANMVLSINRTDGTIKLTSILRDIYVEIPGYTTKGKLNNAFARGSREGGLAGGAQLTMRTINHNFHLNIDSYVVINFYGVASIIDALGGVDIDMTAREAGAINTYLKNVAYKSEFFTYDTKDRSERVDLVREAGVQHCDGIQALMYARLREIDNDFARTARQRHLLECLLKQVVSDISIDRLLSLMETCLPYVFTNLSASQLVDLALFVLQSGLLDKAASGESLFEQHRVPMDRMYGYITVSGSGSVINMGAENWRKTIESIQYFIYGESFEDE